MPSPCFYPVTIQRRQGAFERPRPPTAITWRTWWETCIGYIKNCPDETDVLEAIQQKKFPQLLSWCSCKVCYSKLRLTQILLNSTIWLAAHQKEGYFELVGPRGRQGSNRLFTRLESLDSNKYSFVCVNLDGWIYWAGVGFQRARNGCCKLYSSNRLEAATGLWTNAEHFRKIQCLSPEVHLSHCVSW